MVVNIEDAGFEIRDVISWIYGSGFPKSLDVSKAIDNKFGAEREVTREGRTKSIEFSGKFDQAASAERERRDIPSTDEAKRYNGWGTALKPAQELWTLARKPLSEKTVAENVLKHGTGGINIDACRIEALDDRSARYNGKPSLGGNGEVNYAGRMAEVWDASKGRFPVNVIFDEFMAEELDNQSGILTSGNVSEDGFKGEYTGNIYGQFKYNQIPAGSLYGDTGGASRFFYVAKPSQFERSKGLNKRQAQKVNDGREIDADNAFQRGKKERTNIHPTVKPIELMRYLVKLITPKGGICLDPFCGSGTTLIACKLELMNAVGLDKEIEYCQIAESRIAAWNPEKYISQTLF